MNTSANTSLVLVPASVPPRSLVHRPLIPTCLAFASGIALDHYAAPPIWGLVTSAWLAILGWWIMHRRQSDELALGLLLLAVLFTGSAWHHDRWSLFPQDDIGRQASEVPQPVCVRARICLPPQIRPSSEPHPLASFSLGSETELAVEVEQIRDGLRWFPLTGLVRVRVNGEVHGLGRGDRVQIWGLCERPRMRVNPGEFDGAAAERGRRCLTRMQVKTVHAIRRLEMARHWTPLKTLDWLRQLGRQRLFDLVGTRHAALAAALLLGDRDQLPEQVRHGFFVTGLAHLLAISGLNVAIFSYGFWLVARLGWAPRRWSLLVAMLLAVFYAAFTDAQPPVVRAAILVVTFCLARWSGRAASALNMLALAALLVLMMNPLHLFQTGAQLSFLAVAILMNERRDPVTVGTDVHPLDQLLQRHRPWWRKLWTASCHWIRNMLALNIQVWAVSLPLVICRFHLVSLISIVLNPLVVIPTTIALYAGFGCLVCGRDPVGLGPVCGWLTDRALTGLVAIIEWGETIHGGHFWTATPPTWWLLSYFLGLLLLQGFSRQQLPSRWAWVSWLWWLVLGAIWLQQASVTSCTGDDEVECTFVSVGHGTSVVLRLPGGRTLLYDCGRLGWPPTASRLTAGVLWEHSIEHLDAVVLSHADTDHYNGLPDLLRRFSVGMVYVSPHMFPTEWDSAAQPLARLQQSLEHAGIRYRELSVGDRLLAGPDVLIEVLHPPRQPLAGSDNSHSIVLLIEYQNRRILLPGDLEAPGLDLLLNTPALHCDVVMAPHHGSARSDPTSFLQWCQPCHVVVSGAGGRDCRAVELATTQARAQFWHTARHGAVQVLLSARGVRIKPFRSGTGTYRRENYALGSAMQ
ncbi:MAG: ComEC/Rec2 family competence protein [Planctomycetota bacterium]